MVTIIILQVITSTLITIMISWNQISQRDLHGHSVVIITTIHLIINNDSLRSINIIYLLTSAASALVKEGLGARL